MLWRVKAPKIYMPASRDLRYPSLCLRTKRDAQESAGVIALRLSDVLSVYKRRRQPQVHYSVVRPIAIYVVNRQFGVYTMDEQPCGSVRVVLNSIKAKFYISVDFVFAASDVAALCS